MYIYICVSLYYIILHYIISWIVRQPQSLNLRFCSKKDQCVIKTTTMDNFPFIDDLPIKNSVFLLFYVFRQRIQQSSHWTWCRWLRLLPLVLVRSEQSDFVRFLKTPARSQNQRSLRREKIAPGRECWECRSKAMIFFVHLFGVQDLEGQLQSANRRIFRIVNGCDCHVLEMVPNWGGNAVLWAERGGPKCEAVFFCQQVLPARKWWAKASSWKGKQRAWCVSETANHWPRELLGAIVVLYHTVSIFPVYPWEPRSYTHWVSQANFIPRTIKLPWNPAAATATQLGPTLQRKGCDHGGEPQWPDVVVVVVEIVWNWHG
jgi:hypothetical protein